MNNILEFINNNIFAIVTAVVAVIALCQTHKQMKLSNKQSLFDKRIRNYTIVKGLIDLYEENEYLLKEEHKKDEPIDVEFLFYGLINNTFLENQHYAIEHPLEQPYQKNFLIKLEELSEVGNEIKFIYKNLNCVQEFVNNYKDVLHSIYKYQNINNKIYEYTGQFKKTYKQGQKNVNEPFHRKKLLESYSRLIKSYEKVLKSKSINKIEKEIKI